MWLFNACGCCTSGAPSGLGCSTGQVCFGLYNPVTLSFFGGKTIQQLSSSGTVVTTCTTSASSGSFCCFTGVSTGLRSFKIKSASDTACDDTKVVSVSGCLDVQQMLPYCCQGVCYIANFPFTHTGNINFRTNVYSSGSDCDTTSYADLFVLINNPITSGTSYSGCGYSLKTFVAGEADTINSGNIKHSVTVLKDYYTPNYSGGGTYGYGACQYQPWSWCTDSPHNYTFGGLSFKQCNAFFPRSPCGQASGCAGDCSGVSSTSDFYITQQLQCADKTLYVDTDPTNSGFWGTEAGNTLTLNFYDPAYSGANFGHWNTDPLNQTNWSFEWRSDCFSGQFGTKGSPPFYYVAMRAVLTWVPGTYTLTAEYGDDCSFFSASLGTTTASGNLCEPAYLIFDGVGTVYE